MFYQGTSLMFGFILLLVSLNLLSLQIYPARTANANTVDESRARYPDLE